MPLPAFLSSGGCDGSALVVAKGTDIERFSIDCQK